MPKTNINRIIRGLIVSDFFLFFAIGLLSPIFAVFILRNVENRIEVIGFAVSLYWLTRVVTVIPFSKIMDKLKGELDEYTFMIIGTFITAVVPLFYIFSTEPWHIYLLQIVLGLANSLAVPAWRILFTNHIDSRIVGFEWSLEDVGIGMATAASASAGAFIADKFGFDVLFVMISACSLIGTAILIPLSRQKQSIVKRIFHHQGNRAPFKIDDIK